MECSERICNIQIQMIQQGIEAHVITSADPHLSEYLAPHWKFREYLSGFTGSAGTLVITQTQSMLWTDSRYYLQAETELGDSGIALFRMGEPEVPGYMEFLAQNLKTGSVVGVDGRTISYIDCQLLADKLKTAGIRLDRSVQWMDTQWFDRPALLDNEVTEWNEEYAGAPVQQKIEQVRAQMQSQNASHYLIGALDEIAWLFNLRGQDVPFNPVFHAYALFTPHKITLFINTHQVTASVARNLEKEGIGISLYTDFYQAISELPETARVFFDPQRINAAAVQKLNSKCKQIRALGIVSELKSVKNSVEQRGIAHAHVLDGVALVKFLIWLEKNIGIKTVTEISAAQKLQAFRAESTLYRGDSFEPISAMGAHGAIVHYTAQPQTNAPLTPDGLYLIDSGGQYLCGTTDVTRTIALGMPTPSQKLDYTLVLKGHIALANACFPEGTRGAQLDALARNALWQQGLNYGHGTGHGVGCYLNVHEGPQSIRPHDNGVNLKEGMLTSNEPALYRTGEYGIRIENLILCTEKMTTGHGKFLGFETVTLCPIDTKPIDTTLLTRQELEWLNTYHGTVYEKLSPLLLPEEANWLRKATQPIG